METEGARERREKTGESGVREKQGRHNHLCSASSHSGVERGDAGGGWLPLTAVTAAACRGDTSGSEEPQTRKLPLPPVCTKLLRIAVSNSVFKKRCVNCCRPALPLRRCVQSWTVLALRLRRRCCCCCFVDVLCHTADLEATPDLRADCSKIMILPVTRRPAKSCFSHSEKTFFLRLHATAFSCKSQLQLVWTAGCAAALDVKN